jgi:hypothetical protein
MAFWDGNWTMGGAIIVLTEALQVKAKKPLRGV